MVPMGLRVCHHRNPFHEGGPGPPPDGRLDLSLSARESAVSFRAWISGQGTRTLTAEILSGRSTAMVTITDRNFVQRSADADCCAAQGPRQCLLALPGAKSDHPRTSRPGERESQNPSPGLAPYSSDRRRPSTPLPSHNCRRPETKNDGPGQSDRGRFPFHSDRKFRGLDGGASVPQGGSTHPCRPEQAFLAPGCCSGRRRNRLP